MAIQNDGGGRASGKSWSGGSGRRSSTPQRAGRPPARPVPARVAPPQQYSPPPPSPSYDGGGAGGGFSAAVAAPPAPTPAPTPMKDIDWFNQDSVYRGQSGKALTDLTSQLAQILADRDSGYMQLDTARGDLARNRQADLTGLGNDFAGRGLLSSGLYAQEDDQLQGDYSRQSGQLDNSANELAQMYGKRDSMVDLKGLGAGKAPANLADIYGLLGSMGIGAGNSYNSAIQKARAESAQRATGPLINTTGW